MSLLDDDGHPSSDFIAVEKPHADSQQALWVGVRRIWYDDQPGEIMVQICYQEHYIAGSMAGPVWLTPQTWRELNHAVESRLRRHDTWRDRLLRKVRTGK